MVSVRTFVKKKVRVFRINRNKRFFVSPDVAIIYIISSAFHIALDNNSGNPNRQFTAKLYCMKINRKIKGKNII